MNVVDCSVLAKLVLDEPKRTEVRAWFEAARHAQWTLLVPDLAFHELGNVVKRRSVGEPPARLAETLAFAFLGIESRRPKAETVFEVATGLSFYDAAYVALAKEAGATLVTLDERMAKVARKLGIAVKTF